MGESPSFGRKAKGVRIYAEDAVDYVETLLKRYRQRANGQRFSAFVNALSDEELARFASAGGTVSASETPRAVPFYCPFCGEQDIRPAEPPGCDVRGLGAAVSDWALTARAAAWERSRR